MLRAFQVLFFLGFLIPIQNTEVLTIQIGAITNPTTRVGREQKVAIQLAVKEFSNIITGANILDLNTTDPSPVSSYAQSLIQLGVDVIVAGGTVPQVFISGAVGEDAKVPVVSMASSPFLSGTYLVKMSYPETAYVRCIADVVKSYNWRKVIAVYEDDVFGSVSSTAYLLSNALRAVGSEIEDRVVFPPADSIHDINSTVKEGLSRKHKTLSTVYIILRISEELAPIIFREAASQGLMGKGYVWICGNDITTLLDSSLSPSFISKNMQGVVGIRSYINESSAEYLNFRSNFQQRFKTDYEKSNETSSDPGVYAVRAYDVVHAISIAAKLSDANNRTLIENIAASSNISGLSGLINATSSSLDDTKGYSVYQIINVVGKSYWEMGIWVDGHGFYENDALQQPSSETLKTVAVWPGRQPTTPAGLRRLSVFVPFNTIWVNFVNVENYNESSRSYSSISGYCVDVFSAVLSCLGYEILYDVYVYSSPSYDNLVNQVHLENADIVIGDVTILADRSEIVSFTKPYLSSGLAMLVPVETDMKGWWPTRTFSWTLWVCILILLLYYVLLVWFHELVEDVVPEFHEDSWWRQFGASLWIVCNGIFLNLDPRIRSYHTEVVIILWFFVAQLVLNSFTASLSSILVTQNLRPDVDITKIGCDNGSFVPNYLNSTLNHSSKSNIVEISNGSEYIKAFENGNITAAYLEVPYLQVFLSQHDNYTVYGETEMLGGFGFVLPKGSFLANDMSDAILKLGENGTLRQLEKKWFPVSLSNYAPPDSDHPQSLGLSNYTYVFVLTSCLALLNTVFLKYFKAIWRCFRGLVVRRVAPHPPHPAALPASDVELAAVPNNGAVQRGIPSGTRRVVPEMVIVPPPDTAYHGMDDVPLHDAVHIIRRLLRFHKGDDAQPGMGILNKRIRRQEMSSNISTDTHISQPKILSSPKRVPELDERPVLHSAAHETKVLHVQ